MNVSEFQKYILSWYRTHRRDLPWKKTKDPYHILVSELMLQQTQVSRVLPKYEEFLKAFPTVNHLAKASNAKLMNVWQGLGYWRRALYLRSCARNIVKEYGGVWPKDPSVLETFPGIGQYTSRAVCCFAFNNTDAFLDTNITRVYLHFFFPRRTHVHQKEILELAQQAVWKRDPRTWHYALFDYGSLVLKDKKINKKSSSYHKQQPFQGSVRQYRAMVMRFLLHAREHRASYRTIQRVIRKESIAKEHTVSCKEILHSLCEDGLVHKRGDSYSL